jgi:hypothetical protein
MAFDFLIEKLTGVFATGAPFNFTMAEIDTV